MGNLKVQRLASESRADRKSISSSISRSALNMRDRTRVSAYRKGVAPENISLCFTAEGVWSSVEGSGRARTDCPLVLSGRLKQKAKVGRRITSRKRTEWLHRAKSNVVSRWRLVFVCEDVNVRLKSLPLSLPLSPPRMLWGVQQQQQQHQQSSRYERERPQQTRGPAGGPGARTGNLRGLQHHRLGQGEEQGPRQTPRGTKTFF